MSTQALFRVAYATAAAAIVFGLLAITLSLVGADETDEPPAPTGAVALSATPPTTAPVTTLAPTTLPPTTLPPTTLPPVTAPPTTAPSPPPVEYAVGSLEEMICATFGDQCAKALSVVHCESRFNPGTVGAAGERGLFQIHPVHIPYLADRGLSWDAMFDPASNIAYAHDLYSRSGWGPWTCA